MTTNERIAVIDGWKNIRTHKDGYMTGTRYHGEHAHHTSTFPDYENNTGELIRVLGKVAAVPIIISINDVTGGRTYAVRAQKSVPPFMVGNTEFDTKTIGGNSTTFNAALIAAILETEG